MRKPAILSAAFALVAVLGCGGDEGPSAPELPSYNSATGSWLGDTMTEFGGPRTISMTLEESNHQVTGSYAIAVTGSDPYWTGTVSGSRDADSLALMCPGEPTSGGAGGTVEFLGEVTSATTIEGHFFGSGWSDDPIVLTRQ